MRKQRKRKRELTYTTIIRIVAVWAAMLFALLPQAAAQEVFMHRTPMYIFDLPNSVEGSEVQHIYEDRSGYLWFATKSGLIRYDGSHFKTYRHSLTDSSSISLNYIEIVFETSDGSLWVGTWGGGLNKLDRKTDTFTRFRYDPNQTQGISNDFISELVEDQDGYLWIATRNGLNRYDLKTGEFKHFFPEEGNPQSISDNEIRTLYVDQQNTLWVGTGYPWEENNDGGLNKYHPATETFTQYLNEPGNPQSLANNKVTAIFEDSEHNFWIGTKDNHIHLMDRPTGTFAYQAELSDFEIKTDISHIRSFFEQEDGNIWICSYGSGMKNYNLKEGKQQDAIYAKDKDGSVFFPLNHAWKVSQTSDGSLWICTGDMGDMVYKSDPLLPYLGFVSTGDDIQSLYFNPTTDDLWVARHWNGLFRSHWTNFMRSGTWRNDPKEKNIGNWFSSEDVSTDDLFDNLFALQQDQEGLLWFTKYQEASGLYCFDPVAGTIKHFKHQPQDPNSLADNTIADIKVSPDGQHVWVLNQNGILNRWDKETQTFARYANIISPTPSAQAGILFFDNNATLWIANIEQNKDLRLSTFDPLGKQTSSIPVVSIPNPDTSFQIIGLQQNSKGEIWLGTDRLLCKIDPDQQTRVYPIKEDEIGYAASFLVDEKDHIWLASSLGLFVFNPEKESFFSYAENFEFRSMPFHFRSAEQLSTKEFLFCGDGGCAFINQKTKKHYYTNQEAPKSINGDKVLFTAFLLNGEKIKQGPFAIDSILVNRNLTLSYTENNFSFELSLLDFISPSLNRFEYFLENYDTYWRKTGDQNIAYYSQIPPGSYQLRIRGYNANGAYGEAEPINITILPPWWRTWWAYAGYVLLLACFIYSLYRFQLGRQLANAEAQRLQELDTAKSQLYTNITHEFRTPLTVILGMAKQLEGQVTESQNLMVDMISRNGQNLLNLVNQMLDLSKLESGQMSLKLQQGDLISYLKYLVESFHSYAESRAVKVHFLSDLESQVMDFDPDKMQQIISNLVSNAIKFTPSGGDIYISVTPAKKDGDRLSIRIKDTGVGIEKSRLPHIFKRFYQVDDSYTKAYQGTGIGLALVSELVKLMKGDIKVKSELGKGAEFTLLLPVEQTAEQNQDLSYFDKAKMQFYREGFAQDEPEDAVVLSGNKGGEKPSILIVEDNFDVRTYIRACLSDQFNIISAENGQRGVEKAIQHIPDFIISDVMMPLKDGYSLVKELKSDPRSSHIPIILLTAKADTDSKLRGLIHGADAYLAKPFNPRELQIRIQKLLELRKKLQQHYLSLQNGEMPVQDIGDETTQAIIDQENEFVKKVKTIVLHHLDNFELDVKTLCREVGMSHSQLHRKLSALTGLSTNKFIRHIRLLKAKELLQDAEQTITAVAFDTGFKDPSYFGRVFKQETGMTPAEWQKAS